MTKSILHTALLAGAVAIVGAAANAAPILLESFDATSANNDATYGNNNGGHSVHLPGVTGGSDFDFSTPGLFSIFNDGTATLTGTIVSDSLGSAQSYDVNVSFDVSSEGSGGPKKELKSAAYSPTGGGIDTDDWRYFSMTSGTLTNLDPTSTVTYYLFEAPKNDKHPFQIGFGASGKNLLFGGSGWFYRTTDANVDCGAAGVSCSKGDFNLDLSANTIPPAPVVPVPAAGLLLPVGLGALAFASRRRKKAAKA